MNRDEKEPLRAHPLKGSNLLTVRGVNERLVLHLVRDHGKLTKAETTRITGLSPNAVSVIFRALESEGLLLRCDPIRGRIGQPSVPMMLTPDARHYVGLKIGRHTFDLVVVNFVGEVLARHTEAHAYPTPAATLRFVKTALPSLLKSARKSQNDIVGLNVATPFELWSWTAEIGAPKSEMDKWRDFDLEGELKNLVPWPITVENDGTAACRAELIFAPPIDAQDLVYFFVGTFIGGGVVLNGSVFPGRRGSSGGFGPLRVPDEPGGDRLVDHASLVVLERMIAERGGDPLQQIYSEDSDWGAIEPLVQIWMTRAARSLAHAIISTLAVIDFETVIIDGAFPPNIRTRLVREVENQLDQLDMQGIVRPNIKPGHFGGIARALGAAAHQISTEYMIDQNTLLRQNRPASKAML
ncbi:ROK family transcriptional regulator [Marinobacter alexandrii]|jgi:predicted NBD/HSP70 family sugar kinase|uniref:ROK family transcriptional regulator n=1 Tax=Marinobacter alexandrii TaxID=2570351 RepID=UPI002ABE3DC5|nr:ROK family transcriptional regulator [Marinobacter alexandrii]